MTTDVLTKAQRDTVLRMKPRLTAHGWKFIRATRAFDAPGGIAVEVELLLTGNHHYLIFYPDGSAHFAPVTIGLKNGEAIL